MTPDEHDAASVAAGALALLMQNEPLSSDGSSMLIDTIGMDAATAGNLTCLDVALAMVAHTEQLSKADAADAVNAYIQGMLMNPVASAPAAVLRDSQLILVRMARAIATNVETDLAGPFDNDSTRIGPAITMALWASIRLLAVRHSQSPGEAGRHFALRVAEMAP